MPTEPTVNSEEKCQAYGACRSRHIEMLFFASVAIVGALLLEVGEGKKVYLGCAPAFPIPQTCYTEDLFGIDCPACGLTRSFIHLAQLDWHGAWKLHRLGWLLFFAALLQFPYRLHALYGKKRWVVPVSLAKGFTSLLIALLIINWLAGVIFISFVGGN